MLGEVQPAGVGGAQGVDGEEHRPVTLLLQITLQMELAQCTMGLDGGFFEVCCVNT